MKIKSLLRFQIIRTFTSRIFHFQVHRSGFVSKIFIQETNGIDSLGVLLNIKPMELNDTFELGPTEEQVRNLYKPYLQYFTREINFSTGKIVSTDKEIFTGKKILDLGCGRGILVKMLKDTGCQVSGCDTQEHLVQKCLTEGLNVYHEDALSMLKKSKETFDAIICGHIIEHLHPNDAKELIELVFNRLNKDGIFLIITPNSEDPRVILDQFWHDLTHVRPYPRVLLEKMLEHHGLKILYSGDHESETLKNKPLVTRYIGRFIKFIFKKLFRIDMLFRGDTVVIGIKTT